MEHWSPGTKAPSCLLPTCDTRVCVGIMFERLVTDWRCSRELKCIRTAHMPPPPPNQIDSEMLPEMRWPYKSPRGKVGGRAGGWVAWRHSAAWCPAGWGGGAYNAMLQTLKPPEEPTKRGACLAGLHAPAASCLRLLCPRVVPCRAVSCPARCGPPPRPPTCWSTWPPTGARAQRRCASPRPPARGPRRHATRGGLSWAEAHAHTRSRRLPACLDVCVGVGGSDSAGQQKPGAQGCSTSLPCTKRYNRFPLAKRPWTKPPLLAPHM